MAGKIRQTSVVTPIQHVGVAKTIQKRSAQGSALMSPSSLMHSKKMQPAVNRNQVTAGRTRREHGGLINSHRGGNKQTMRKPKIRSRVTNFLQAHIVFVKRCRHARHIIQKLTTMCTGWYSRGRICIEQSRAENDQKSKSYTQLRMQLWANIILSGVGNKQ